MNPLNDATKIHAGDDSCDGFHSPSTSSFRRHSVACVSSGGRPWYHGEMGKAEAERILEVSPAGSFLLRLHAPTRYYLSTHDQDHVIQHLPITQLSRQFYFNGEKYSSLSELVESFASSGAPMSAAVVSPTATGHLNHASTAYIECEKFICTMSFEGISENDELSTIRGDIVSEIDRISDDWIWARNERTSKLGHLPSITITPVLRPSGDPSAISYFHEPMREESLHNLVRVGVGSFLLRNSSKGIDAYALCVNTRGDHVEKFLIQRATDIEGGYILAGRRFASIEHIIERYCRHPIATGLRLTHAFYPSCAPSTSYHRLQDVVSPAARSSSSISDAAPHDHQWSSNSMLSSSRKELSEEFTADFVNHNTSHIVATVQALRKSREEKPWKTCFVTLRDDPEGGCHLFITDSETSSRKRLLLDLSFCVLYLLDDSVFGRDACVFFSQNDIDFSGIYISFRPAAVLVQWMNLLRPRVLGLKASAVPIMVGLQFKTPKACHVGLLHLHVDKYRSDALKPDGVYSAYGSLNGVKVCCTQMLPPAQNRASVPCVVFDSSFLIPFAPVGYGSLQLSLISHNSSGKKNRPFGLSPLLGLADETPLNDNPEQGFAFRALRIRILVQPAERYSVLEEWLSSTPAETLEYLSDGLSAQQRSLLCVSLVAHHLSQPIKLLSLLEALIRRAFSSSTTESVMRQDSLATALLTHSLRVAGRARFEDKLEATGVTLVKLQQASDVDAVVGCLDTLVIEQPLVLHILHVVSRLAEQQFPGEPHVVRRVLSAAYVLRFANPLVINAVGGNSFGQQLAKGVQAAANMAAARTPPDMTSAGSSFKGIFERIRIGPKGPPPCLVETTPSRDWLAVFCHLLGSSLSSREGPRLPVPEAVANLLAAHQACST